ncbi:MAG: DUF2141 domain-containing protein [Halioglobus sp.]
MPARFRLPSRLGGLALALATVLVPLPALAETAGGPQTPVRVELEGLVEATGKVYIAVYDNDDDWLGDDVFASKEVDIESSREGELVSTEILLPPGEYAITIFHDSNGNGELDTNFIGLPKEPIAMSNNAKPKFGPPKYEDAAFEVVLEPIIQRVKIKAL